MTSHYQQPKNHSNWTGRTPRTLQGAFGPHAQWYANSRRRRQAADDFWHALGAVILLCVLAVYMIFTS